LWKSRGEQLRSGGYRLSRGIPDHDSINAFAAPAGYIFVTRGLLKQIKNEAELAGVWGHEIAHVSQKHILDVI
jgi:predicted Zn-dependent protease